MTISLAQTIVTLTMYLVKSVTVSAWAGLELTVGSSYIYRTIFSSQLVLTDCKPQEKKWYLKVVTIYRKSPQTNATYPFNNVHYNNDLEDSE